MRYGISHPLNTANFTIVTTPGVRLAFSYDTLIGFYTGAENMWGWIVRENAWGPTTGKHLNWLQSDKKERLNEVDFNLKFMEATLKRIPTGEYV